MTARARRKEQARVQRALGWANRKLRTSFVFHVCEMSDAERRKYEGATFATARANRGMQDPALFSVTYNPEESLQMNLRDLRRLAGHEALHCIVFPLGEAADNIDLEEAAVYVLQRALFGEVGEP